MRNQFEGWSNVHSDEKISVKSYKSDKKTLCHRINPQQRVVLFFSFRIIVLEVLVFLLQETVYQILLLRHHLHNNLVESGKRL